MPDPNSWSIDLLLHLRTFVAVADVSGFSAAAEALGVGQPLLSRRIRALEDELGEQLFDRSRRQIALTSAGRRLLEPARELLTRAELFSGAARNRSGMGDLRLALPPDGDPRLLAHLITSAAACDVALQLLEMAPRQREEALADGSVGAAVTRTAADQAEFIAALGFASNELPAVASRRELAFDDLRPRRRGAPGAARRILLAPEDSEPDARDAVRRAALRGGLTSAQLEVDVPTSAALVRALSSADVLLATRTFAVRNNLPWAALADISIRRSYRLDGAAGDPRIEALRGPLAGALARALGARRAGRAMAAQAPDGIRATTGVRVEGWE